MVEPRDQFPDLLRVVVDAVLSDGIEAGRRALEPIAMKVTAVPRRTGLSKLAIARVFVRDRFSCRYCGGNTIAAPVLRVVSSLFASEFPYHPHWRVDRTHPAYLSRASSCDHVYPGAHPASLERFPDPWTDIDNLATACWTCQAKKADLTLDQLGWQLRPVAQTDWDGLTSKYEALWIAAGQKDGRYHRAWIAAFKRASAR